VAAGPVFVLGSVTDSSLNATGTIRAIRAVNWLNTGNGNLQVSANNIGSLVITGATHPSVSGDFDPNVQASSIGFANIGGQVALGTWDISSARMIVIGSALNTWNLNATGKVTTMIVRNNGLPADVNVASLGTLYVSGDINDTLTLGTGRVIRATGVIVNSSITSAGDLLAIVASAMRGSTVEVGSVATGVDFASIDSAAQAGGSTLSALLLTSNAANSFSNSSVIAHTITRASLGPIDTTQAGGLAAVAFSNVSLNASGTPVHMVATDLDTPGTITSFKGTSFGDVEIKVLG
jgi:hypothetical protein